MSMIYEVRVRIANGRAHEWLEWIVPHVRAILDTNCFTRTEIEQVDEPVEADFTTFVVRYHAETRADYDRYVADHASAMRADGIQRFGTDMVATRSLLSPLHEINTPL